MFGAAATPHRAAAALVRYRGRSRSREPHTPGYGARHTDAHVAVPLVGSFMRTSSGCVSPMTEKLAPLLPHSFSSASSSVSAITAPAIPPVARIVGFAPPDGRASLNSSRTDDVASAVR